MTNFTETTDFIAGFAASSQQYGWTAVPGTAVSGSTGMPATGGEFAAGFGCGRGNAGVEGGTGLFGSRVDLSLAVASPVNERDGGGVPGRNDLALERGKRLIDHIAATPRYGAPGECPRRIPA